LSAQFGVLIAIISSCLGGTAAAVTPYLVGNADPVTLAILRWVIGFLVLLPVALLMRVRWRAPASRFRPYRCRRCWWARSSASSR
jgi:integral membrane sensor domain MASE1